MAFMVVNTNEENIKDYTGDNPKYINKSGIYDVVIKSLIVDQSPSGSVSLNMWIDYNGQEQPIFQAMRTTNNDGSDNLGKQLFMKLAIIAGACAGQEIPDPVKRMVPIGKGRTEQECNVLEIFDDVPVTMRIQMEYSLYEGKIQERKVIRNFFRITDKATALEIVDIENNKEDVVIGKQFLKEQAYLQELIDNPNKSPDSIKGELTIEDIEQWKKEHLNNPKKENPKKPAGGFGGKRFGK